MKQPHFLVFMFTSVELIVVFKIKYEYKVELMLQIG